MPREVRRRIEDLDELYGILEQSNISAKNMKRLETLCQRADDEIRNLAAVVQEVARVHPRKRRRYRFLAARDRDLFRKLKIALGQEWFEEMDYDPGEDWLVEREEFEFAQPPPDMLPTEPLASAQENDGGTEIPF